MRFIITATSAEGHGDAPAPDAAFDDKLFTAYMKYNEELTKAGVLVASEGLNPASKGARIEVSGGKRVVVDGPFAETKELLGGFYVIDVSSVDEAIAWALRCPVGMAAADVLEIRQLTGMEDIPPELVTLIAAAAPTWFSTLTKGK